MSNENTQPSSWFPEIMYEEDSRIPFVPVPSEEKMPDLLFMFESRETGEFEPGVDGEPVPIVQMDLHQYANMNTLKLSLDPYMYDEVRLALGLEPAIIAAKKGQKITEKVRDAVAIK